MATKAELLDEAEERGIEVDASATKAELEAALGYGELSVEDRLTRLETVLTRAGLLAEKEA